VWKKNQHFQVIKTVLVIVPLFFGSCGNPKKQTPIVARVGSEVLTIEKVKQAIPLEYTSAISEAQVRDFIQRWIDNQILYQEALRRRIHLLPKIKRQLEEIQKELIVAYYLESTINNKINPNDSEIQEYYRIHRDEFIRPEELRHIWLILVPERNKARSIRRQLLTNADFQQIAKQQSKDPSAEHGGDLGFVPKDKLFDKVGNIAFSLPVGRISQPINSELGYYLVKVIEVRKKGEIQELEEVYDLIRERLLVHKRVEEYEQLLARLKESVSIEKDLSIALQLVDVIKDSTQVINNDITTP